MGVLGQGRGRGHGLGKVGERGPELFRTRWVSNGAVHHDSLLIRGLLIDQNTVYAWKKRSTMTCTHHHCFALETRSCYETRMSRQLGDRKHGHHEVRGLGQVIDQSQQSFGKVNFGMPSAEVRLTLPSLPGTNTVSAGKNWALLGPVLWKFPSRSLSRNLCLEPVFQNQPNRNSKDTVKIMFILAVSFEAS
jgi:hypothetical protein